MGNTKFIKPCFEIEKDGNTYVCMGVFHENSVDAHTKMTPPETHEYYYTLYKIECYTSEFEIEIGNICECGHAVYSEKNESWITNSHPDYQYTLGNSTTLHVARLKKGVNLEPESEPKRPASALYNEINTAIQNHSNNNGEYDINLLKIRDLIENSL